jgi:hypothetical protein
MSPGPKGGNNKLMVGAVVAWYLIFVFNVV